MTSTTIDAFWSGWVTTTEEIVQANWGLFYVIIGMLFAFSCIFLIIKGLTYFFGK